MNKGVWIGAAIGAAAGIFQTARSWPDGAAFAGEMMVSSIVSVAASTGVGALIGWWTAKRLGGYGR